MLRATILSRLCCALVLIALPAKLCAQTLPPGEPVVLARHLTDGSLQWASAQNLGIAGQFGGNYAALEFSDDNSAAFYGCYKNRQATKGAGGKAIRPGDNTCELQGSGWDGAHYNTSGTLDFSADGPVRAGDIPTNLAIWLGGPDRSGISDNTLALLLDSHANAYLRNGNLGIGAAFGYNPPASYAAATSPPWPLSISRASPGTVIGAYVAGSTGGGAQIEATGAFSSTEPIYGFWYNSRTGIGNPAPDTISFVVAGSEAGRIAQTGAVSFHASVTAPLVRYTPTTFPALPACDSAAAGTIAYITDASAAITAWHQHVTAGGGSNKAFIACNGSGWYAFDY